MGVGWHLDVALCIDGTRTMNDIGMDGMSHLERVKRIVKRIGPQIYERLRMKHIYVHQLRFRIIVFRDYLSDGANAVEVTDWFTYPDDLRAFETCVDSITASGGGNSAEDGLEALAYAITSKWIKEVPIRRHVIMVFTDAGTHNLGNGKTSQYYPRGMPKDIYELTAWWDNMNENSKRLVLLAPDENCWNFISRNWDNVIHYPSLAGQGITDKIFYELLVPIVAPDL